MEFQNRKNQKLITLMIIRNILPHAINKRKNGAILTKKVKSLAELKFDSGFQAIGEYLSQNDSILRVNLTHIFPKLLGI